MPTQGAGNPKNPGNTTLFEISGEHAGQLFKSTLLENEQGLLAPATVPSA
jgi:hypothetical protein